MERPTSRTLPCLSVHEYIKEKLTGGLRVLPVEWGEAAAVEQLPMHHRDPFDRLLIAQAHSERLAIVTSDPAFERYGVTVVW